MKRYVAFFALLAFFAFLVLVRPMFVTPAETVEPAALPIATKETVQESAQEPVEETEPQVLTAKFSSSGDNLIHNGIYLQAHARANYSGYDFSYAYDNVRDYFSKFDINLINQETLVNDELPPSNYPMFSTPGEMGHELYDTGFTVFSLANNHTYDKGAAGLSATMNFWQQMPNDVFTCGIYDNDTDYTDIALQEVNGIKIAYLSYTEMTNGIPHPENALYHVVLTSETEIIQSQIELAKSIADIVVVSVHWGTEYSRVENDMQKTLAQDMANWGADLIVGTHPHVVQNAQWLTANDGREVFVAYSLGNFISAQDKAETMVGVVLECEFTKQITADEIVTSAVINPKLTPVITHYDRNYANIRVYMYEDYTAELAQTHGINAWAPIFSIEYIEELLKTTISDEFLAEL